MIRIFIQKSLFLKAALLLVFILSSCGGRVTSVDFAQVHEIKASNAIKPVKLSALRMDIPLDRELGVRSSGSRGCGWPFQPVNRQDLREAFDYDALLGEFDTRLESLGYKVAGDKDNVFGHIENNPAQPVSYYIGAKIVSANLDICEQDASSIFYLFSNHAGVTGEMRIEVEWRVLDENHQTVIRDISSFGYARLNSPQTEGVTVLLARAFAMAAHNLAGQSEFRALFSDNVPGHNAYSQDFPKKESSSRAVAQEHETESLGAAMEKILKLPEPRTQPIEKKTSVIRKALVQLENTQGEIRTGVFITRKGHILTSTPPLGRKVSRVLKASFREKVFQAKLVSSDQSSGMALYRLSKDVPAGEIEPLALRKQKLPISSKIYTWSLPSLSGPVQSLPDNKLGQLEAGLISSYLPPRFLSGPQMSGGRSDLFPWMQLDLADKSLLPGTPVMDSSGNVVALIVSEKDVGIKNAVSGLTLAVPAKAAFRSLVSYRTRDTSTPGSASKARLKGLQIRLQGDYLSTL